MATSNKYSKKEVDIIYSTLSGISESELYLYQSLLNRMYPTIRDEEVESVKEICCDHLLVNFKNTGNRFIWCNLDQEILNIPDEWTEKSEVQVAYEFKHMIKYWIRRRVISQKMLSDITGYTTTSISRYINCERTPDLYILRKLAEALNITVDKFYLNY